MTDGERDSIIGIGGKLVDGLKNNPAILALIILNIILMAAIFWSVREQRQMQLEIARMNQSVTADVLKLLAACQQEHK